jgi:predicted enzyme involved in methoxymalonyl-ACP biosynthesis
VVLLDCTAEVWTTQLLLMSCRVMSRGIGGALLTFLRAEAKAAGVALRAEFRDTGRNRMMYITYKFAGFSEMKNAGETGLLENDLSQVPPYPTYLKINAPTLCSL